MIQTRSILSTSVLNKSMSTNVHKTFLHIDEVDFISVFLIEFMLAEVNDILIFTSQNAVKSVLNNDRLSTLTKIPCLCVGINTKLMLESHGFHVMEFTHYAKDLAQVIISKFKNTSFTFFAGNIRSKVLPDTFAQYDILYNEITTYHTFSSPVRLDKKYDSICFYSPSGVRSFLQNNVLTNEVCFCIGVTTADALKGVTENIILADYPTIAQTMQTCINYYESSLI